VKNVWVNTPQIGSKKTAKTNFTQRVGTVRGLDVTAPVLARATLLTIFPPRLELRVVRLFFNLRFVAAKVTADYADLLKEKQD
jgi:hypothetical protein